MGKQLRRTVHSENNALKYKKRSPAQERKPHQPPRQKYQQQEKSGTIWPIFSFPTAPPTKRQLEANRPVRKWPLRRISPPWPPPLRRGKAENPCPTPRPERLSYPLPAPSTSSYHRFGLIPFHAQFGSSLPGRADKFENDLVGRKVRLCSPVGQCIIRGSGLNFGTSRWCHNYSTRVKC